MVFRSHNSTCWSRHLAGYRELLRGGFRDWWLVLFPPWGLAKTWQGYITHVMHVVLHCLVFTSYIDCHLLTCLLYKSYIWIISCHHVSIDGMFVNYGMPTYLINTLYSYIMSSYLHSHHILQYVFPSFLVSHHNVKLCHAILFS